tara:strand:- start:409 stop:588 length:180 start_codon:yes stop_codon:yes gene_type:complete
MNLISLYLKISTTGIITFAKFDWNTKQQFNFSRVWYSLAIELRRMLNPGDISIGCRIYS